MTRNPRNIDNEKLRIQKEGLKEQNSENKFFKNSSAKCGNVAMIKCQI